MRYVNSPKTNADNSPIPSKEFPHSGFGKAALDYALALLLIVPLAPIMLFVALAVRLSSRGPIIYSQTRVGRGGRPYMIYKFRTMCDNCERFGGAQWSKPGDPRVTRLGRFLRAWHLDELPQLWNVLKGDMSLVGPRPERPEFVPKLADAIPGYIDRLAVMPGVTGLAQVQLPPDTDLDSVRRKLCCDLHYVRHRTLWLDFRLMLCTGLCAVGVPYRLLRAFLAIPSPLANEIAQENPVPPPPPPPACPPSDSAGQSDATADDENGYASRKMSSGVAP